MRKKEREPQAVTKNIYLKRLRAWQKLCIIATAKKKKKKKKKKKMKKKKKKKRKKKNEKKILVFLHRSNVSAILTIFIFFILHLIYTQNLPKVAFPFASLVYNPVYSFNFFFFLPISFFFLSLLLFFQLNI